MAEFNLDEERNRDFMPPAEISRFQTLGLGIGVIGIILLIVGALATGQTEQALRSYLLGYIYWAGIGIGMLGLLILQHLTGGSWGVAARRVLEAGAQTMPLLLILSLPIILQTPKIYEWAAYQAGGHGGDKILDWKAPYLNIPFFIARTFIYYAIWFGITYYLVNLSKKQDKTGDWRISHQFHGFSGVAMIIFVLAVSFAAVDWAMSLDPHWFSTIYGLLFLIGFALSALSFLVLLMQWLAQREPMNHVLGAPHFHDWGKLMLAMVMVWTYFNLSQIIIIWSGNLPEETPWYLRRMANGWDIVGVILILFHFALPFFLLLQRDLKRRSRSLAIVALFILLIRAVDLFYLIMPNPWVHDHEKANHFNLSWMDPVAIIGVGGIWVFAFFWLLRRRPLMPINDPFFENTIAHGREHH